MSHNSKTFEFTHDGETFQIPSFTSLPIGVIRKSRKAKDEADQVFTILEGITGEDSPALAAIDSMSMDEFQVFMADWTQGAPVGESVSSES